MDFEEKIEGLWTGYFMNTKKTKKKTESSEIILVASKTSGSQFFTF